MSDRPNIVMVSWDSVRSDHLSFHGYQRDTAPTLAAVADDGLVFEDAQVPGVGTPSSFTGVFTGQHTTGIQTRPEPDHWTHANADRRLLPEALQDAGYHTGAFHYNALMSRAFGWDRGWDTYDDHMWTEEKGRDTGWKTTVFDGLQRFDMANFVVHLKQMVTKKTPARWESMWNDVETFVEDAPEPWFLWVLLIDTHHPYYAPKAYHEWPQPGIRRMYAWNYVMRRYRGIAGERRPSIVNAYDNTIRYADAFLDRLVATLEANGHGGEPIIVHSDHGDEFGEHAVYGHRPLMYDTVTRVPLVMQNVGETGRIPGPTTLLDLGNTVLDLAGTDERLGVGASLLAEERVDRDSVIVENRVGEGERMVAVVGEEWKVLHHPPDDWEAYYRPDDPLEKTDRWGEHPAALGDRLQERLSMDVSDLSSGRGGDISVEARERLTELGYID